MKLPSELDASNCINALQEKGLTTNEFNMKKDGFRKLILDNICAIARLNLDYQIAYTLYGHLPLQTTIITGRTTAL